MGSADDHRAAAEGDQARCGVLTVSDTRTEETDDGGRLIVEALTEAGHKVEYRQIVPDNPDTIATVLDQWLAERPDL
ncbi:MAG: molybdopterin-binding protein, partial [Phycisphaeraceae bacterium]|nr:molybdopterin-binding protein [Phycisphaeraceae bacterium]